MCLQSFTNVAPILNITPPQEFLQVYENMISVGTTFGSQPNLQLSPGSINVMCAPPSCLGDAPLLSLTYDNGPHAEVETIGRSRTNVSHGLSVNRISPHSPAIHGGSGNLVLLQKSHIVI